MRFNGLNFDGYEAKVLGREQYLTIAKKHNLCTKTWTMGRVKEFKRDLKEAMESALNRRKSIFKRLKDMVSK